jgi:Major intrinsic protein
MACVAFAARGHFPWDRVPGYVVAQVGGATAAPALLRSMFGTAGRLGGTFPGDGIPAGTALVTEIVLTFGLMTVILGTSSGPRNVGHNAAIAIGGYVALLENSQSYAEWLAGISSLSNRLRMVQRGQDVPRVLVPCQRGLRMAKREKREAGDVR